MKGWLENSKKNNQNDYSMVDSRSAQNSLTGIIIKRVYSSVCEAKKKKKCAIRKNYKNPDFSQALKIT